VCASMTASVNAGCSSFAAWSNLMKAYIRLKRSM
jgi:hypothetical protein